MSLDLKSANIISSFRILRGNTRACISYLPLWGIPFVLYNFYLSLYMKGQGITNRQIGYLISMGFVTGAVFSLFGGIITDRLGRKKTTLIFDLISWPLALFIYAISSNFWMFVLGAVVNSTVRIVVISFNLLLIEDADSEQRVAAYNLQNILTIAVGIVIPLGGLLVKAYGIVSGERIILIFAVISMALMMVLRNRTVAETSTGKHILAEHSQKKLMELFKNGLYKEVFRVLKERPSTALTVCLVVIFNTYVPIGAFTSLYYAPFMTEVLKIDKAAVSILGGIYSTVMLFVFMLVNPVISRYDKTVNMIVGIVFQAASLFFLIIIPVKSFFLAAACVALFAIGFGMYKPFMDSMLAEETEGRERAGIYSLFQTLLCVSIAITGVISGYIYTVNPKLIYILSLIMLACCVSILIVKSRIKSKGQ